MPDLDLLAAAVATGAAFLVTFGYYVAFGGQLERLGSGGGDTGPPPAWIAPVELVRTFVVALVVAGVVAELDLTSWTGGALLALALWIGFPAVLLTGSVIHEKVPGQLAAIHAGDWLVKLLIISVTLALWD